MPAARPTIYLIAGCNGAGKTTFAKQSFPHEVKCLLFYDADQLARGLATQNPPAWVARASRVLVLESRRNKFLLS